MAKTKTNSSSKPSKKKAKISGPNVKAMKQTTAKPNPFETIWSRRKFDIIGKKRKGEERRLSLSRSVAIDKRKKTLLKEYEESGKASVFIDNRMGESNEGLGEFDKALLRSQRERQVKHSKKSLYNLSDGEEEELDIGCDGMFGGRDDFEDEMLPYEDDDAEATGSKRKSAVVGQLSADSAQASFGKGSVDGEDNAPKTKKEVMQEIISKSKFFKLQKAKDKEENEELADELDKKFESMVQSEALISLTQPSKMNALKALVNKNISFGDVKKDAFSVIERKLSSEQDQPDSYDKLVKEMGLEMRARPSDRTKTPEEIAQEERDRLEKLEKERQKRMLGADNSSDEEDDVEEHNKASKIMRISVSGDDLGDSFTSKVEPGRKRGWVDEVLERRGPEDDDAQSSEDAGSSDGEDEDEDEGEDDDDDKADDEEDESIKDGEYDNSASLKDWEQDDDENLGGELRVEGDEEPNEDEDAMEQNRHKREKVNAVIGSKKTNSDLSGKHQSSGKQNSLPFTIEAPTSFEELSTLLENRSDEDVVEAVKRIRGYNAIGLKAENRKKMQVFYGLLLQYFAVLAGKKPMNLKLLNSLVRPLMEMSSEVPYFAAICARERILRTRTQFCDALKNSDKSAWPTRKTLFLLRLWSMTFPCSDFRHVVMTPATLLMCEYLMRCPILSGRDIAVGLFLCSMVHGVIKQFQKFCPELLSFIQTLLIAAIDQKQLSSQSSQLYILMELKAPKTLLCIQDCHSEIKPLDFLMIMDMEEEDSFFSSDSFRIAAIVSLIENLRGLININGGYNSFPEIFISISKLMLQVAEQENMPGVLKDKLKDVGQLITRKAEERQRLRQPLQMRKQKPVPIKLVNPKFEENFVKGRDYDPDRERAERRKMKKLIRQEAKGAIRELRKDNQFLFAVKQRDKLLLEEERAEKYGRARAFLQEQEHAFKSGQLGKGKGKRRKR